MLFPCKTRYNKRVIKTVRIFRGAFFYGIFLKVKIDDDEVSFENVNKYVANKIKLVIG